MKTLRRIDDAVARGEAAVAVFVLLAMISVAVAQAALRTLAAQELHWANAALGHFGWADPFLQKGTLWLAFLGASLATRTDKHIAIDVLQRIAPTRLRHAMHACTSLIASVVCFFLARIFRLSILNNGQDVPLELSMFDASGHSMHVCAASASEAAAAGIEDRPSVFCGIRFLLEQTGNSVSTPENALELIVPAMLLVMGVRFLFKGVGAGLSAARPDNGAGDPPQDATRAS